MKIPSWPAWFPYPISWLRGFVLSRSFGFFLINGLPEGWNGSDFLIVITVAWLVQPFLFTFLHYLTATMIQAAITGLPTQAPNYDRIHQWLTSKRCSGTWRHCREGLTAFVVMSFGLFFLILAYVLIIVVPSERSMWRFATIRSCLPVTTAYLYQYDLWTRQRRVAKQERRSQNSTAPAANPIKQEFNRLKADAGATRMRPVRQATPEIPEWYVFRSGKVEGPYSKLQLWEVQKITARTKVRRGEADWQRAGKILELAKYLSKK